MRAVIVGLVLASTCQGRATSDTGADCDCDEAVAQVQDTDPGGSADALGLPRDAWYWIDAHGVRVTRGERLIHIDGAGIVWDMTPGGRLADYHQPGGSTVDRAYWREAGCTGDAWVQVSGPMHATWYNSGSPADYRPDPGFYYLPSGSMLRDGAGEWWGDNGIAGHCDRATPGARVGLGMVRDLVPVSPPALQWAAPLERMYVD